MNSQTPWIVPEDRKLQKGNRTDFVRTVALTVVGSAICVSGFLIGVLWPVVLGIGIQLLAAWKIAVFVAPRTSGEFEQVHAEARFVVFNPWMIWRHDRDSGLHRLLEQYRTDHPDGAWLTVPKACFIDVLVGSMIAMGAGIILERPLKAGALRSPLLCGASLFFASEPRENSTTPC